MGYIHLCYFELFGLKLPKYKGNNKKISETFYHNFKNIALTIVNNELDIIRKTLFLFYSMVSLLQKFKKWRLTMLTHSLIKHSLKMHNNKLT